MMSTLKCNYSKESRKLTVGIEITGTAALVVVCMTALLIYSLYLYNH